MLKRRLHRLVWVYTCRKATLLEITSLLILCFCSIALSLAGWHLTFWLWFCFRSVNKYGLLWLCWCLVLIRECLPPNDVSRVGRHQAYNGDACTVKPVLSSHPKRKSQMFLRPIFAKCRSKVLQNAPNGSILQYFQLSLSYHMSFRSLFCLVLSGRLRPVLLYVSVWCLLVGRHLNCYFNACMYDCLLFFGLILNVPVNSYGHIRMVSSPNYTFFLASFTKQLTSTLCTYFRL